VAATPDKWQWMVWLLLVIFFLAQKIVTNVFLVDLKPIAFIIILWLCMPYRLFYNNSNWFANMQQLNKQLTGSQYYFADHDNMMHWELLDGFSESIHCKNLAPAPYKVFALYYDTAASRGFSAGWLLINKKYTERTEHFLFAVDSLESLHYFGNRIEVGDMEAFYINNAAALIQIKNLASNDEKVIK
jgi:hypothetical protein